MKNKKAALITAMSLLIIAAFVLMSYPILSNYLSSKYNSKVRTVHYEQLEKTDDEALWNAEKEAIRYNGLLSDGISDNSKGLVNTDYNKLLNISNDGIMGYIEIPSINVYLPIAHGTDAKTLENSIGHVIGSSLPIGGKGTHAVLSGHSGLASQPMFNDLHQLNKGDLVYIHVLRKVLAYKVNAINTVLPSDVSLLSIKPDKDELTLITCTPVGINTHRLLVHCSRTDYVQDELSESSVSPAPMDSISDWTKQYIQGLCAGAAIVLAAVLLCLTANKGKKRDVK